MRTREDIAWVAGLFEGEGCINIAKAPKRRGGYAVSLHLVSTDRDVIDSLNKLYPGKIFAQKSKLDHHKKSWRWHRASIAGVREVLDDITPYMHSRRATRILEACAIMALQSERATGKCRHGHEKEAGSRCKVCREKWNAARAADRARAKAAVEEAKGYPSNDQATPPHAD